MEKNLNKIIVEKNDTFVKVEQLCKENQSLVKQIKQFQKPNQTCDEANKQNMLETNLEKQKIKISELEVLLKATKGIIYFFF